MLANKQELSQYLNQPDSSGDLASSDELRQYMSPPQSLPQELWQGAKDVVGGLGKFALDNISAGKYTPGIAQMMQLADKAGLQDVYDAGDKLSSQLPGNPNDAMFKTGEYLPFAIQGGSALYGIGRSLGPLAYQAGKAGVNALGDIPGISQLVGRNVTKATEALADKTKNVLADLYNNPDFAAPRVNDSDPVFGNEDYLSSDAVRQNYLTQKGIAQQKYKAALDDVGDTPVATDAIDNYKDMLGNVANGDLQSSINNSLKAFNDNPTVNTGHDLQSKLGSALGNLYKKAPNFRDDDLIDNLTDARNSLRDYISDVAGPAYQDASDFYKQNVVPYAENRLVANMALKGKVGSANALTKALSNGELEDADRQSLNAVASHMNDDQKDQMLLSFLRGTKNNPLVTTGGDVNPDVLLNSINGLKFQGLDQFVTPKMQNYFNVLNDAKNNIAAQDAISKKARWIGGGALALSPLSYELRHLF